MSHSVQNLLFNGAGWKMKIVTETQTIAPGSLSLPNHFSLSLPAGSIRQLARLLLLQLSNKDIKQKVQGGGVGKQRPGALAIQING